jgi:hypothetical protein
MLASLVTAAIMASTPVSCGSANGLLAGERLYSLAPQPPRAPVFSTSTTWYPALEASSAAVMPEMPPPTTSTRRLVAVAGLPAGSFIFFTSAQPMRT